MIPALRSVNTSSRYSAAGSIGSSTVAVAFRVAMFVLDSKSYRRDRKGNARCPKAQLLDLWDLPERAGAAVVRGGAPLSLRVALTPQSAPRTGYYLAVVAA